MLDFDKKSTKIKLKNISTKEQEKLENGIQLVSIHSPLGNSLLGKEEGDTIIIPELEHRVYIEKVYALNHSLKE